VFHTQETVTTSAGASPVQVARHTRRELAKLARPADGFDPKSYFRGALREAYGVAKALHRDPHDLIQKAVGWMLREAGKSDPARLERYLNANGPRIPRTTVRYAIERFAPAKRLRLLRLTRSRLRLAAR
jgi:hypothetical protein